MIFCLFSSVLERKFFHSTKSAPLFWDLFGRTGQHRSSPAPWYALPHPLQNRVPRGERAPVALCREPTEAAAETKSFCPCQKSQVSLLRYLTFSLVCGRIWQRGAPAGSPAERVDGRWSPVATPERRPSRQARQVRPSIFAMLWWSCPPFPCSVASFLTRLHPSPTAATLSSTRNAPGFAFFGPNRVRFAIFSSFDLQNFWLCFCASCRIVVAG